MEMVPDYETNTYHIELEYEYKGQARGDAEMESVLNVITKKVFTKAAISVKAGGSAAKAYSSSQASKNQASAAVNIKTANSQKVAGMESCAETLNKVITAIQTRNYSNANTCFTLDGLEMYNKLISYGTGRIVGTPSIKFFNGVNGNTVARGLQMSFSFRTAKAGTMANEARGDTMVSRFHDQLLNRTP